MDRQKFHKADKGSKYQGVYYRESNRGKVWWIAYRKFGKLVWEKVGHEADNITKVHAKEYRAEKMREIRIGEVLPGEKPKITVAEAFKIYVSSTQADGLDISTELSRYNKHIHPHLGSIQLGQVTPQIIIGMKKKWQEAGLATGTRRQIQFLGSRVFAHAIHTGIWAGKNPFSLVSKPNNSPKRERYLLEGQAHQILSFLKGEADRTGNTVDLKVYQAVAISLFTGLRKSEIRRLTRRNLLNNNTLIRVKTKHKRQDVTRHVQVPEIAQPVINSITWPEMDRYFGGPFTMDWITKKFVRAVNKLGFNQGSKSVTDRITFHSLRHTYGSWHALNGTPLNVIRELMGHADIGTTEKYLHLVADHKTDAMERFSKSYTDKTHTADDYKEVGNEKDTGLSGDGIVPGKLRNLAD